MTPAIELGFPDQPASSNDAIPAGLGKGTGPRASFRLYILEGLAGFLLLPRG